MKDKKKSTVNLGDTFKKLKGVKIKKERARLYTIILLVIIVLLLSTLLRPIFYSSKIKQVMGWNLSEGYNINDASKAAMTHVRWKEKKGVITLTGKDRKTGDKIVIIFEVGDYMSFESMTRNDEKLEYFEWEAYMRSYQKN